jgi:hypothetical protein
MTVSTTASRAVVQGNGITTAFTYPFLIPGVNATDQTNVEVIYQDTLGANTVLNPATWSITGVNNPAGGTVIYNPGGIPITTGSFLAIVRIVPLTQDTTLGSQGAYDPETVEDALDTIVLQIQQLNTEIGQKLGVPLTAVAMNDLPTAINRAGKFVGFDTSSDAQAIVATGTGTGGGGGTPGGTNGQTQYNNAGAFGGYTFSGDLTVVPSTGVATLPTVNANVGSFTTANITVDGKGRITAAANGSAGAGVTSVSAGTGMSFTTITSTGAVAIDTAVVPRMAVVNAFTKTQHGPSGALTISANLVAWDASSIQVATLSVDVNATLSNPTNLVAGETFVVKVTQAGGGGHTLAYGTVYKWAGGTAPVLSTANGAIDILSFVTDGTNMYGAFQQNFS